MALTFGRGGKGEGGSEFGALSPSLPTTSSGSGLTAFIDQGSEFEGKLSFKDCVRIDGRFVGEISSENTLIVGESGEIEAKIRSQVVEVSGAVTGDVVATRKLILHKTARLEGNVETAALVMEEGASLNGRLTMAAGAREGRKGARPETTVEGGGKPKTGP
jgi:cytoskeletal protein CcmA (bactofilin family)